MHLGADVVRDQTHDPLAIPRRQALAGIDKPAGQSIDPEPAVRIEHDLDDVSVFEPDRDGRPKRRTQHARAARDGLLIEMMTCHLSPPAWRPRVAVVMSGVIRKGRMQLRATRSDRTEGSSVERLTMAKSHTART